MSLLWLAWGWLAGFTNAMACLTSLAREFTEGRVQALVVVSGDPVEGDFVDVRKTSQGAGSERGNAPYRFVLEQSHVGLERGLIVDISDRSDRGDETFEHPGLGGLHRCILREFIPSSQYT